MTAALALLVVLAAQDQGNGPPGPPAPTREQVAKAVRDLGADDYHVREQATAWLWGVGTVAESALRDALRSTDAEVVARARDLLDKIPYGITPDMPRRFVELIAAARAGGSAAWPGIVPELLDLGPRGLEVARKLAERLGVTPGQRAYLLQALDQEGWRVVPHLLAAGQDADAEGMLERAAVAGALTGSSPAAVRHYAAATNLRGQLPDQVPRWRKYAEDNAGKDGPGNRLTNGQPGGKAAAVILTYLARLNGDLATARWAAEQAGMAELKEAVLFDTGAWAELAALPPTLPGNLPVIRAGMQELYLRAAGKTAEADKALADLKQLPYTAGSTAPSLKFRALMFAGRPDDALAVLADAKGSDAAIPRFEVLAQRGQYSQAFQALTGPMADRIAFRWLRDTARVRVYHQLGDRDNLRDVLRGLQQYDQLNSAEITPAQDLVEQLVALRLTDEALPIAAALLSTGTTPRDVFEKLYPKAPLAAEAWWRYLRLQQPSEAMRDTVARLPELLGDRLKAADAVALIEAAAAVGRGQSPAEADRWLQGLGESCQAAGRVAEAKALYEEAAKRFDSAAGWQKLGEFRADQGQFAEAAAAFETAWRKNVRQPLPLWLAGWAKTKAGDEAGKAQTDLAHLIPLGDDEVRNTFAEELGKRTALAPEAAEAARRERRLIVQLGGPTSSRGRNAQGILSGDAFAYSDRLAAADATQRFLFRMLQTNAYFRRHEGYLSVLYRAHNHRARGLLATGDVAGAVREAETAHTLVPSAADLAVALVPDLAKGGHTAEADKVYGQVAKVLDGLCKEYPKSTYFANQRAWLAARCRRDLDTARELAGRAVQLAPHNPTYLDTLAEVHFQKGERAAALERLNQALAQDPKNEFYRKQKTRFEAGDPAAPVPEVGR